jgi:hypothetical protein
MPHISGTVKAIFDNRLRDGKPSKFPNFKIVVDDVEATLWSAIQPVCKKGDRVSLHYGVSKKNGSNFVLSDENKNPKIQVFPEGMDDPLPNNDLPESEKQWLSQDATEFDGNILEKQATSPQVLKEEQIFCTALIKSSIEGKYLEPTAENLNKMILMLKDVYKKNFKQ